MVEDKTPEAFVNMAKLLTAIGKDKVDINSPFWKMTKTDVCRWFKKNHINAEAILNWQSVSCYEGGASPCYRCESCFRKACAMWNAGMHSRFDNLSMLELYYKKAQAGMYISERNKDIISYAEWRFS